MGHGNIAGGTSTNLFFLGGKRTPFGANGGALQNEMPAEMSVVAAKQALKQAHVSPDEVDHVVFGNVLHSAPNAIYIPRHIGLKLGIPQEKPALGINRLCGSGFQVVVEALHQMMAGDTKIALVGGVENMSMSPYVARGVRFGTKMGPIEFQDSMMEGLYDSYAGMPMAITAENLSTQYQLSRETCDEFALRSQTQYKKAHEAGKFKEELVSYPLVDRKGKQTPFEKDEHPRDSTPESLSKLKPVFKKDGVVTAGNASGIVDGSAALVCVSEEEMKRRKAKPLGRLVSYGIAGCDPKIMGIGPVPAIQIALKRAGMTLSQMDLIEVNEAFAPQTLSVMKELEMDPDRVNVNGGAIAIGHPLAASGTRITMTLLYELRRRKKRYGVASACIGGGQGIALIVEAQHD